MTRQTIASGSLLADDGDEPDDVLANGVSQASPGPAATPARGDESLRQTFLVGPTVYLRPIELADADNDGVVHAAVVDVLLAADTALSRPLR